MGLRRVPRRASGAGEPQFDQAVAQPAPHLGEELGVVGHSATELHLAAAGARHVDDHPGRARPVAKTPFAKNLTTLLNSGQGLALAIVLSEILGPPRSKK